MNIKRISARLAKEAHYTCQEAAKLLGVKPDTIKRYANQTPQRLKAVKLFGTHGPWLIPQSATDKYLETASKVGRPKASQKNGSR